MAIKKRYLTPILWFYGLYSVTCLALAAFVAVLLLALPLKLALRRKFIRGLARGWFFVTGVKLNVHGVNHLGSQPAVVVANHASYVDGVLLKAILPTRFGFVIKREVTKVPFLHFLLRRIGAQFVERRNRYRSGQDAKRIVELAKNGHSVAVFPEGTFVTEPGLAAFRPGAFAAAIAGSLNVVPVAIEGTRAMLPADRRLPRPATITVTFLAPLSIQGEGREAMRDMASRSREAILSVLKEPDLLALQVENETNKENSKDNEANVASRANQAPGP